MALSTIFSRSVFLVLTAASATLALEYKNTWGNATVEVTVRNVDDSWGTTDQKCVEFVRGAPSTYTRACFTSVRSNETKLLNCVVTFDDRSQCDSCTICTTDGDQVGFENACGNFEFHARVNTDGCVAATDRNIQSVLVDDQFGEQDFAFTDAPADTSGQSGLCDDHLGGSIAAFAFLVSLVMFI